MELKTAEGNAQDWVKSGGKLKTTAVDPFKLPKGIKHILWRDSAHESVACANHADQHVQIVNADGTPAFRNDEPIYEDITGPGFQPDCPACVDTAQNTLDHIDMKARSRDRALREIERWRKAIG